MARALPSSDTASLRGFRRSIREVVDRYFDFEPFMDALTLAGGLVTGSVANYVACPSTPLSPTTMDVIVPFGGFDVMVKSLTEYGYKYRDEAVMNPWKGTATSVHLFWFPKRRNRTPAPEKTIQVIRCKDVPYAVYTHLLSSPSTHETTFFSPSAWVTFYPGLYEASQSWVRWSDKVNVLIRDRELTAAHAGFTPISSNETWTAKCTVCPSQARSFLNAAGIHGVVYNRQRRRDDVYGLDLENSYATTHLKWSACPYAVDFPPRHPPIFFAPSEEGVLESNSDELIAYKLGWIKQARLKSVSAILIRPSLPPVLLPLPLEPNAGIKFTLDNAMAELWFCRPSPVVWSLEPCRTTVALDEDEGPSSVSCSVYVSVPDRRAFEDGEREHQSSILVVKHTDVEFRQCEDSDLNGIKRFVYMLLDPTLDEIDTEAGYSDGYVDSDELC
ncbi:hypothetical protein K435DRAFT_887255 [Dendrothele bispora CBS 962.96]|uniref:Uncharacterized protein n=1 Tax=Dendrothele bispora (strain CBS 962.96) TaxID=1314807 RepID=A0A4S8KSE9_DENBC|nr:hypothetical protein K435DRAFT_887255 [Dendrothele bispora CBS 962.96]